MLKFYETETVPLNGVNSLKMVCCLLYYLSCLYIMVLEGNIVGASKDGLWIVIGAWIGHFEGSYKNLFLHLSWGGLSWWTLVFMVARQWLPLLSELVRAYVHLERGANLFNRVSTLFNSNALIWIHVETTSCAHIVQNLLAVCDATYPTSQIN